MVGPKTVWPGAKSRRVDEIRDGTGNTILLVEAHGLGVNWMEPKDLDFDQLAAGTGQDPKTLGTLPHPRESAFFSIVEGGDVNVAFADGSVHAIPWGVDGEALAPLLTGDDDDDGDLDALPFTHQTRLNWARILSLAVLAFSTLLLWWSTRPTPRPADAVGSSERGTPSGERGPSGP